jgi:RNA polymerase sigma-70 factor (ECF subfamily)
MSPLDSFTALMDRLKAGEDGAARLVFERFATRLVGLARKSLDGRLLQKVDPEDVVQSAYKSFFLGQREGAWEFGGWDGLWGMLTLITLRKCAHRAEYFRAEKRDVRRELAPAADSVGGAVDSFALDREPQPEEAALLVETVEALFSTLTDPDERAIAELSLQGFTAAEIVEQTGRAERSVRRLRERMRKRLERMQADE